MNNSGYITADSIIQAMAVIGTDLKLEEARLMIRDVSSNCKGNIDLSEFTRIMDIMKKDILFCVRAILVTSN